MKPERILEITDSFPEDHKTVELNMALPHEEFATFEPGIFATTMDLHWHAFVHYDYLYFARSWTGHCIYKIEFQRRERDVLLKQLQINNNPNIYHPHDLEKEISRVESLVEMFLRMEGKRKY